MTPLALAAFALASQGIPLYERSRPSRWWKPELAAIRREGILVYYPDPRLQPDRASRWTDSLHVVRAYENAMEITKEIYDPEYLAFARKAIAEDPPFEPSSKACVRGPVGSAMLADLQFYKGLDPLLIRLRGLVFEFASEIDANPYSKNSALEMIDAIESTRGFIRKFKIPKLGEDRNRISAERPDTDKPKVSSGCSQRSSS